MPVLVRVEVSDYLDFHEVSKTLLNRAEFLDFVVVFHEQRGAFDGLLMSLSEDLLNLLQQSMYWVFDLRWYHQIYLFK